LAVTSIPSRLSCSVMKSELVSTLDDESISLPTAITAAREIGLIRHHRRHQDRMRIATLPYTAAIASSAMTPRPPGSASNRLAGQGLITSNRRNTRNPVIAP
jgi:hypothetical protein